MNTVQNVEFRSRMLRCKTALKKDKPVHSVQIDTAHQSQSAVMDVFQLRPRSSKWHYEPGLDIY